MSTNVAHHLVPMRIFKNRFDMVNLVVFHEIGVSASGQVAGASVTGLSCFRYDNCCNAGYVPIFPNRLSVLNRNVLY